MMQYLQQVRLAQPSHRRDVLGDILGQRAPMSPGLWTKSIRLLSYELVLCIYIYTCLLGAKDLSVGESVRYEH